MSLMREIRQFAVPKSAVALWWFGQNSYIFKSHEGTLTSVDMYLTDSCNGLEPSLDLSRQAPVLIAPEELDVDVFSCTHNHQDHTDPWTIRGLRNKDTMQFVGPHPSCEVYRSENVEEGRIIPTWPKNTVEFRDVSMTGTFALPTDDSDLNHMGYVYSFGSSAPKIYVTGDTDFSELLFSVEKQKPDIVITVINGGFNNLSHWEAAEVCSRIKPKVAIPCHYDMFADNAIDPKQFRATLGLRAPGVTYQQLEYGKPYVFEKS
jgi:L-ascorbate 6-phosphate lactonase